MMVTDIRPQSMNDQEKIDIANDSILTRVLVQTGSPGQKKAGHEGPASVWVFVAVVYGSSVITASMT